MMPNPATVEILWAIICPSAVVRLPSLRLQSKQWKSTKISFQITLSSLLSQWENCCSGIALNRFQSIRSSQWKGYFLPSRWIQFPIAVSFKGRKIIPFNCNISTKSRWIKLKLCKSIIERQKKKSGKGNVSLSITSKRRGFINIDFICIYSYPIGFKNGAVISLIAVDFSSQSYWALWANKALIDAHRFLQNNFYASSQSIGNFGPRFKSPDVTLRYRWNEWRNYGNNNNNQRILFWARSSCPSNSVVANDINAGTYILKQHE